ncbi:MAG: hypothetical protein ACP5MX_02240 [Candidatus Micrarchaeia archaeon]
MEFYELEEMPRGVFNKRALFTAFSGSCFFLEYRIENRKTYLCAQEGSAEKVSILEGLSGGIKFTRINDLRAHAGSVKILSCYADMSKSEKFSDFFSLPIHSGFISIAFMPLSLAEISRAKSFIEHQLSSKKIRESSQEHFFAGRALSTVQKENFIGSEEQALLANSLNALNSAMLSGESIYKFFIIIPADNEIIEDYLKSSVLVLFERKFNFFDYSKCLSLLHLNSLPFPSSVLSQFVGFYGASRTMYPIATPSVKSSEGINIGYYLSNGIGETGMPVKVDPSSLNLGFIITGLPGSGKTREAMSIIDQLLLAGKRPKIAVISPTDEWSKFGQSRNMNVIRLYKDNVPINFFRKPSCISKEKFYENLATVLASSLAAGPYENPAEKCMLNAFKRIYAEEHNPDPIEVYNQIENSIANLHAKKTATGTKYTKHGENIKSALENLRIILSRPEYASANGINIEDLLEKGIIFDISSASSSTRPYLYALLLNMLYGVASCFDTNGDSEIRLVICLEEAQIIFNNGAGGAVEDLGSKIQDFRKQGVGLLLLAHNVTDIDSNIRRLCQLKLYMKQAADIAPIAMRDLILPGAGEDVAITKLKVLESMTGAFNGISKNGSKKAQNETVFIRTNYCEIPKEFDESLSSCSVPRGTVDGYVNASFKIEFNEEIARAAHFARVVFLGEPIFESLISELLDKRIKLIIGKRYTMQILDGKKRILKEQDFMGSDSVELHIEK